jgi:hypothetical protein
MRKAFRKISGFRRKPGRIEPLERYAKETLAVCADRWNAAAGLDTAIRDDVAQGLAYLVYSAYDSISASRAMGFGEDTYASGYAFVSGSTSQWFRERGFAEWFCIAAGCLFNNQRPRILSEMNHKVRRVRPRKKKAA